MTDLPAEGWYDDPDAPGGLRWWTGATWSDHRRPPEQDPEPENVETPSSDESIVTTPASPTSAPPSVPPPPSLPWQAQPGRQQPAGQWQQPTQWRPAVPPPPVSGRAAASLIVGLLWLFGLGSLMAIPLGIIGRRDVQQAETPLEGGGMAIAGIIVGIVGLVMAAFLLFALV